MPRTIPNTTVSSQAYTDALTFAGNDIFQWGFFTIANNPCFVQLMEGVRGSSVFQDEVYCPQATYPVAPGARPIAGLRVRAASASSPAPQIFGSLFYPNEPGIQAGTPFTGIIGATGTSGVGLGTIDRNATLIDVAGVAAETDIYNFSVPGGTILSSGMLRLFMEGDFLFNNAGADTFRFRIYFGGTLLFDDTSSCAAAVARRTKWEWEVHLANLGVTNSQDMSTFLRAADIDLAAPATGIGSFELNTPSTLGGVGGLAAPSALDTTSAQVLRVTVTPSAASANLSWRKRYAILENL